MFRFIACVGLTVCAQVATAQVSRAEEEDPVARELVARESLLLHESHEHDASPGRPYLESVYTQRGSLFSALPDLTFGYERRLSQDLKSAPNWDVWSAGFAYYRDKGEGLWCFGLSADFQDGGVYNGEHVRRSTVLFTLSHGWAHRPRQQQAVWLPTICDSAYAFLDVGVGYTRSEGLPELVQSGMPGEANALRAYLGARTNVGPIALNGGFAIDDAFDDEASANKGDNPSRGEVWIKCGLNLGYTTLWAGYLYVDTMPYNASYVTVSADINLKHILWAIDRLAHSP